MVKSEIIEKENCRRVLKIEVPEEQVKAEFDKAYNALIKNASIPGFRKGKAPLSIIKARYEGSVKDEVMQNLISSSLNEAIKEKDWEIIADPLVEETDLRHDAGLSYKAVLEVRPEIKLGDYNKLKCTKKIKKITEEEIDKTLKDIQERFASYITVEKDLAPKDYAFVDIRITDAEKEIVNREGMVICVDDSFAPGFTEKVSGLKKGEEREFTLRVPVKEEDKAIEKDIKFWLRMREVKEKRLPSIDDELARDAGFDSLEKLKEDIRKRMEARGEELSYYELKRQIGEQLLSIGELIPPESVVKRKEEFLLEEMRHGLEREGRKEEIAEDVRKNIREASVKIIKLAYILDEIGRKENIKANKDELEEGLRELVGDNKYELNRVRERLTNEILWENYAMQMREEKIYRHIIDRAEITESERRE